MRQVDPIKAYMRSLRSSLRLPRNQRLRALEEIEAHLKDGAAAHMRLGNPREQAATLAIKELGPPDAVAAGFAQHGVRGSDRSGVMKWLPTLVPVFLFASAASLAAWSLTWFSGGLTTGEQAVQRTYLIRMLAEAVLSYAAYLSIRRARSDAAWRWAGCLVAGCAVAIWLVS